jgi:hypothetical protein
MPATNLRPAQGGHFILAGAGAARNPYDGPTLAAALEDIHKIVGRAGQRVAVDQGTKDIASCCRTPNRGQGDTQYSLTRIVALRRAVPQ